MFNKFFPIVDTCLSFYSPTKLCDGAKMAIFCVLYFQRTASLSLTQGHSVSLRVTASLRVTQSHTLKNGRKTVVVK